MHTTELRNLQGSRMPGHLEMLEAFTVFGGLFCVVLNTNEVLLRTLLCCVSLLAAVLQRRISHEDFTEATTWIFRQKASVGLIPCSLLLPMALVAHGNKECGSDLLCYYQLPSIVIALSLLMAVSVGRYMLLSFITRLSSAFVFAGLFVVIFILINFPQQWIKSATCLMGGSVLGLSFLCHLMSCLPNSFTLGEAMVISEGLAIVSLDALRGFASPVTNSSEKFGACLQVLVAGSISVGFLLRPLLTERLTDIAIEKVDQKNKDSGLSWSGSICFYLTFAAVNLLLLLPWLGFKIHEFPVFYGLGFMFANQHRIFLMIGWLLLVTVAMAVVATTTSSSTVVRKYFHLIAVATFIPGLLWDPELVCLASAGTFFIFIVVELVRLLRVKPFGGYIDDAFHVFVDERDSGPLVLTHIYLLVGFSLPVWIFSRGIYLQSGNLLPLFSGVLSIGIGDTAASVLGSLVGRNKWPGTKKTVEGTLAAVVAQLVCCHLFQSFLGIVSQSSWSATFLSILLTSFLEAFTEQIDNLVLPLFMFAMLSAMK